MDTLLNPLVLTAISLGFIHTLLGPDHYLPFVALSKSNNWSYKKTMLISSICGLAHCLSSVVIGMLGIVLGSLIGKVEAIESFRGDFASYLMISFGLIYFVWSIKKLKKNEKHSHVHGHDDIFHSHEHNHQNEHVHKHQIVKRNLFWGIFLVFLFGPCEPLIPILMYPAAKSNTLLLLYVTFAFTLTTIITMLFSITFALKGLFFVKLSAIEKYSHTLASLTIVTCGVLIVFGL